MIEMMDKDGWMIIMACAVLPTYHVQVWRVVRTSSAYVESGAPYVVRRSYVLLLLFALYGVLSTQANFRFR